MSFYSDLETALDAPLIRIKEVHRKPVNSRDWDLLILLKIISNERT